MAPPAALERVCLDTSALLGPSRRHLVAAAALHYYTAFWSAWMVGELVRRRTEWIAERAVREGCDRVELRRRLRESRRRVNVLLRELSQVLRTVDYPDDPSVDLSWLTDPDDWPIVRTALAAQADTLVTDNSADFPLGEMRNGLLFLGSDAFLTALYARFPTAAFDVREYLLAATR